MTSESDIVCGHTHVLRVRHLERIEKHIGAVVEFVAALLVLCEVILLLVGVISRYVFHHPLTWSDELASVLFIWLAMLGAVIALRRGEHMRMTALIAKTRPRVRVFFEVAALLLAMLLCAFLIAPSIQVVLDDVIVLSPALEISAAWRSAAMPVGLGLMVVFAAIRLERCGSMIEVLYAAALIAVVALVFLVCRPIFAALGNLNLIVFFVILVGIMVFGGIPIAIGFGCATVGYLWLTTHVPISVVSLKMDEGMSHLILLSIPLFVFLGYLIEMTGMARVMIVFLGNLLGHIRGGLSFVLVGAMYLVSGISGSKAADMAAVAPALFPEMKERGAEPGELAALLSASGAQTETIPPSIVLITVGSVTGVSINALFTGGLLPGVVLAIALCVVVWMRSRHEELSNLRRASLRQIGVSLLVALPALALPFVIRAAVVGGVATATEVSTIGIVYSALVGLVVYRKFDWRRLIPMLVDTAALSGAILFIVGAASAMAWALTQSGFATKLALLMSVLPGGAWTFLAVSALAFIVLGSVLEGIPAIVLFGPLLFPIARQMGINEVHYAMVAVLAMGIGLFSPPFGVGYYCACAIGRVNPEDAVRPLWGYMVALLVGLVLVVAIPWISTGFL